MPQEASEAFHLLCGLGAGWRGGGAGGDNYSREICGCSLIHTRLETWTWGE